MLLHSEKINKQAPTLGGLFKSITKYDTISQDFYGLLQNILIEGENDLHYSITFFIHYCFNLFQGSLAAIKFHNQCLGP